MTPPLVAALANHLWQSTVFAGAAMVLALALRSNPARVRYWLWLAASMKFLVPFSLLVSLGGMMDWRGAAPAPVVAEAVRQIGQSFAPLPVDAAPMDAAGSSGRLLWPMALMVMWLCGFAWVVLRWGIRWLRLRALVRTAAPYPAPAAIPVLSTPAPIEPGVFGFRRPVLLLPRGIAERLTAEQLEAILAHELAHVRRRDNLAAAVHMAVEAIFWFHPLVWYIGARLVEERERACDEEVLGIISEPGVYAQGILNVCRFYAESPLHCVSGVTGADLRRRIERIMAHPGSLRLTWARKALLCASGAAALAAPLLVGAVQAPKAVAPGTGLTFEVASVRPTRSNATHYSIRFLPGGALHVGHTTLKVLIGFAYDVREFQVAGGPGWIDADRFDIQAKPERYDGPAIDAMTDSQRATHSDQMRERLRALLAERFQLRVHTESREAPVYALVEARGGHKLRPAKEGPGGSRRGGGGGGSFHATRWTPAMLAKTLSRFVGRDVLDRTGISGEFDIELTWSPDFVPPSGASGEALQPAGGGGPSIFTALREQLGLRLESSRGAVDVIVVDRAEKPSEN